MPSTIPESFNSFGETFKKCRTLSNSGPLCMGSICRQLNFTRSNYKEINGLFVEKLQNNRFHLHIYSRNDDIKTQLENIGRSTLNDPNYFSLQINNVNHLFVVPPFNNSVYRLYPMERNCEFFEKVIEFSTGIHQTIMDIMLLIDTNKFKIQYIVCNRAKSYIAFYNGTDAMEVIELLRSQHYNPKFATCYAKIFYVDDNQPQLNVQQPNVQPQNIQRRSNDAQRNYRSHNNFNRQDNHVVRRNHNVVQRSNNFRLRQNPRQQSNQRRRNTNNNNMRGTRFVRVMMPNNLANNQYEMRLVRRI